MQGNEKETHVWIDLLVRGVEHAVELQVVWFLVWFGLVWLVWCGVVDFLVVVWYFY